ncbi:HTH-type transcriptional regulator YofA [Roseovarius albus]|uniref:HTH-type transcriptional regulator YofA n=1 Tax=Roseovarius albus TaxID=1247867 RepID=A0A1X6YB44_9RHOB|nr:LysR family transcriptional regulator [Roseovarius albus]SLN16301.1 HTH-type transcriptional regulator YofA [Roseovarius albus]
MNITSLQTFLAIVETGNLIRASQKMNVTQSTVTARLKTLEEEVGQQLLNRQKSGTTLTPAGTKLLRYARIMVGLWRQARYETNLPVGLEAVCTFGCDRELWHGPGQNFFHGVVSRHPEMAVSVHQGSAKELEDWITSGIVDVIITYESIARTAQTVYALPPEKLVLHSDDPESSISEGPNYIFVDHGEEYRQQHAETYHYTGVARTSFDSSRWALEYLLSAGGSAYLPRALADPHVKDGRLFPLAKAPIYERKKYLVVNDTAAQNWDWFLPLVHDLQSE